MVADQLRAVHHDHGAVPMRYLGDFPQRRHVARDVGHAGDRHEARPLGHYRLHRFRTHSPDGIERNKSKLRSGRRRNLLPGDQVGVVFKFRSNNLVARLEELPAPAERNHVAALRRALGENNLAVVTCVDELPDGSTSLVKPDCCLFAQLIDTAVNTGTDPCEVVQFGINNDLRFQRGCTVVQVDERLASHGRAKDGKLRPNPVNGICSSNRPLAHPAAPFRWSADSPRRSRPTLIPDRSSVIWVPRYATGPATVQYGRRSHSDSSVHAVAC